MTLIDWTLVGAVNHVLLLERESDRWWTVTSGDLVMMRADRELCRRFMRAFQIKHPGTTFNDSGEPASGTACPPALKDTPLCRATSLSSVSQTAALTAESASPEQHLTPAAVVAYALDQLSEDAYSVRVPEAGLATVHPIREGIA